MTNAYITDLCLMTNASVILYCIYIYTLYIMVYACNVLSFSLAIYVEN